MLIPKPNPFERGKSGLTYRRWWIRCIVHLVDASVYLVMSPFKFLSRFRKHPEPGKILIAKTDHIGDMVLALPTLKALRERFNEADIYLLTNELSAQVVHCTDIKFDGIIIHSSGWVRHGKGLRLDLRQIIRLCRRIRAERFDLFIDLRGDAVMIFSAFISRIPRRIGFGWSGLGGLLKRSFGMLPGKHMTEVIFQAARYFQDDLEMVQVRFVKDEESVELADRFLESGGIADSLPPVGMHIGAGVPARIWSTHNFARLAERIVNRYGIPVIIFGDENDLPLMKHFDEWEYKGILVDAVGKLSLPVTVEVVSRLRLLVANNSSLGHIAGLTQTPVISVFCSSNDPVRWGPKSTFVEILKTNMKCWGCALEVCPLTTSCMDMIPEEEVFKVAGRML